MDAYNTVGHAEENVNPPPPKNFLDLPEDAAKAVIEKVGYRALHRLPLVNNILKEFIKRVDFPYEIERIVIGKEGESVKVTVEDKMDTVTCIYTPHEMGSRIRCGVKENVVPEQDYLHLAAAHVASVIKNPKTTVRRIDFKRSIDVELAQNLQEVVKEGSINAVEFSYEGDIRMSSDLISLINPATIKTLIFKFMSNGVFGNQPILQSPQWKAAEELQAIETEFRNNALENIKHFKVVYASFSMLTPQLYTELKQHFMDKKDFKVAFIRYYHLRDVIAENIAAVVGLEEYSRIPDTDDVFFYHQSAVISKFVRIHKSKVPANVTVLENR